MTRIRRHDDSLEIDHLGIVVPALALLLAAVIVVNTFLTAGADGPNFKLLGLAAAAVAFAAIAFERSRARFDRAAGRVDLQRHSVLGRRHSSYALAEITGVTTQISKRRAGDSRTATRPALLLTTGTPVPLVSAYAAGRGPEDTARTVADWLGQPFTPPAD